MVQVTGNGPSDWKYTPEKRGFIGPHEIRIPSLKVGGLVYPQGPRSLDHHTHGTPPKKMEVWFRWFFVFSVRWFFRFHVHFPGCILKQGGGALKKKKTTWSIRFGVPMCFFQKPWHSHLQKDPNWPGALFHGRYEVFVCVCVSKRDPKNCLRVLILIGLILIV